MALDFLLGDDRSIVTHDRYSPDTSNKVVFFCPNKHRIIKGVLSGALSFTASAQWSDLFQATGAIGSTLIDTIDNFAQGLYGNTIRQPWFGRKLWNGTKPLSFQVPLRFVSFKDAKAEVYDPMMGLLSLIYPRSDFKNKQSDMFQKYFIPGPSIFYSAKSGNDSNVGDRIEIYLGKFLRFKGCYINSIQCNVENSFSLEGWPHNVGVTVSFETMDVSVVGRDGRFMEDGFEDTSLELASWVDKLVSASRQLVKDAGKTLSDVVGFDVWKAINK